MVMNYFNHKMCDVSETLFEMSKVAKTTSEVETSLLKTMPC